MQKTVYWDLINSNMNRDVQEGCANGCTGYIHVAAIRMMRIVNVLQLVNESCKCLWNWVCVKEPDGLREEAPPQSLSALNLSSLPV